MSQTISLFGAYSQGRSAASAGGASLLDDYSTLTADSFGVGLVMQDVAEEGDGFSLMIGQPLRVKDGDARLSVPVGRTESGEVLQEQAKVDLAPDGREIATEATYRFALNDEDHSLSMGAFMRLEPNHDAHADPDFGLGFRYSLDF